MTVEVVREVLGWCLLINVGIMVLWFAAFTLMHDLMYQIHGKMFALSRETFDAIHYGGMAAFKIAIIVLNLAPYVALALVN